LRTGNLGSLSERDWAAIKERRAFEREERDKQLLAEDQAEYDKYVQAIEAEQTRTPRAYRVEPISFDQWRSYADSSIADPVLRGASATHAALLSKSRRDEAATAEKEREKDRETVLAGKPDPGWKIPAIRSGQNMSVAEEKTFVREQARLFAENNSEFLPSKENFNNILDYLWTQGVSTPHKEALKAAWLRLRELGLIEERPAPEPAPEPTPIEEPPSETPGDYEVSGFDPEKGTPRKFTQREIWKMDSNTYRKAFKAWGENKPKFTRGYYS
jgi:hypothetical protein